ncbi:DUF4931 domain-containing protein [Lactobacillus sp. ESL0684]|uniref:DUF4931 domain-containing protein n=1 Tax=Lactobacillus sp. ESL0684 TaxID=2983213 RepID=UPI0023F80296|nr:DUF4931 domain-containing protein [Lactobacillus sp. ESL0684]WEV43517.1 DUF4931 domain-containing protein [Lactobacillus sp. ESL0684]
MEMKPLVFELAVAKNKPHSYRKTKNKAICPFCQVADLTDIYQQTGDMIWLHNKFPTLRDTVQTVLIEASDHHGDIVNYSVAYNRRLLSFALDCFNKMQQSKLFKSVLWYKNYGPHSGGSLVHPHMQLVALNKVDGYSYINEKNFSGITLFNEEDVEVNVATQPVQGYEELNINLLNIAGVNLWADWIQIGVKYLLSVMNQGRADSYNLFFYPREMGGICAKLVPRFAAPPYFVGYKLSQVNDEVTLANEAKKLRAFYEQQQEVNNEED